ncbi:methylated-DNA--[protein]-cysteine S-methyltransferase [Arenibaculum pallidiluteum]|uniref:methylated-DNA--[protein]-cysteine S-methyltransferase n=1 Tax=Arenibaculum pallidiluteum TaxID=2812559 RepID=UPI001A969D20|nr:methylated-DNA--[protein]-cysteine S-methyltransferase [Arenibaculum pallidiluteum]
MGDALRLLVDRIAAPIGELVVVADLQGRLRAVDWTDHESRMLRLLDIHYGPGGHVLEPESDPGGLSTALAAYFAGALDAIRGLPVETGGSAFQRGVWAALRGIPCGGTITYGELARRIGRPGAARAVGLANGANPVGVVVPCHRVLGADGSLTGYGGGIERKRWLLEHERGSVRQ